MFKNIPPQSTIIIGLSGGPDSVYLVDQLHQIKDALQLTLIAAHLNHGWRQEAAHDEQFCRTFAEQHNITFIAAHASEFPQIEQNGSKQKGSQEAYGRALRRAFFARLVEEHPGAVVALAHHKDDQIETFFIRLMRGAGLQGLRGMQARDDFYIRPLLALSKAEILAHLHAHTISYCIDHTNEQDIYLRNRIRKYALPALKACDERVENSILRTMEHFDQIDDFVQQEVATQFAAISEVRADSRWISLAKLLALHPFLQQQIVLHWLCSERVPFTPSQALFDEIIRFLQQPAGGTHDFYATWRIIKKQSWATIELQ